MLQVELFRAALGLADPWIVTFVRFEGGKDGVRGQLHLGLDFGTGARFSCPECEKAGLELHDTKERDWRHLDFFQHQTYLHARVPRVRCPECGVHLVRVPWARAGSGFTLLFEAMAVTLAGSMPILTVSRQLRVREGRIWRILRAYVDEAREELDESGVTKIGVDETSSLKASPAYS
jgi:transposase